ncbi:protein MTSS 2-like [Amphibalanus amphitrite]|uniref:protein MTSS 2-like n=1 Tax=Amphibalanus amphitrite TaxID=1232801 RepID=UPI001C908EBC|nr:protein MTSS 2-like [Amphibalanus amphitrite]
METAVLQLMESIVKDKDACGVMASLFATIIGDLKGSQPLWEEMVKNASRLHSCLKATLLAISAYLDTFQRIADTASAAKGATRDIGTALTRICLRHRAVEAKVKTFASALAECLILPLQGKLEDYKRASAQLEKEHTREYKRQRSDLKKRSTEALRLYKKTRKSRSQDGQKMLDACLTDIQERYQRLEDSERSSLSAAMVEERSRYCRFVSCLQPVVQGEVAVMGEMVHLSEVLSQLEQNTADPFSLPAASEQVICDLKGGGEPWRLDSTPSSPCHSSSLGSRKSSVCSVASLNSCGSAGGASAASGASAAASATSAGSQVVSRPRSFSQAAPPAAGVQPPRLASVVSRDSGFTSQDTLFVRPVTPPSAPETPEEEDTPAPAPAPAAAPAERPHTISTAYERGGVHHRPPLGALTFLPPRPAAAAAPAPARAAERPPPPGRPPVPQKSERSRGKPKAKVYSHYACPAAVQLPDFNQAVPHMLVPQPVYANTAELVTAPKEDCTTPTPEPEPETPTTPTNYSPPKFERCESDGSASSGYGSVHTAPAAAHTDAFPPPPDFVLNNFCDVSEEQRGRPVSVAAPADPDSLPPPGLRRCHSQTQRPPPPVRRHSANWRPQRSVSETVRSLNAVQHRPACPTGFSGAAAASPAAGSAPPQYNAAGGVGVALGGVPVPGGFADGGVGASPLLRLGSFSAGDGQQRQRHSMMDQIRRGGELRQTAAAAAAADRQVPVFRS